jgi:hypothetical protein
MPTPPTPTVAARGRLSAAHRWYGPDDPRTIRARGDLAVALIEKRVQDILETAPPLTDEQRERLAAIFRGGSK